MTEAGTVDSDTAQVIRQALAAAQSGDLAKACDLAEQGLRDGADPAALYALTGMLRCRSGDLTAGEKDLRTALELRPDDARVAVNLTAALIELKRYDEAMDVATAERAEADSSLQLARFRGFAAQSAENYKVAVEAYRQVVDRAPGDWEAWNNLGNAFSALGDFEKAVAALRRASELNPNSPPVRFNLAANIGRAGDLAEAERQLRAMADEFPQDTRALREVHALRKEQGREEEALEAIEAAAQRDPSDVELLLALASHRLLMHQMEAAEAAYHQALKLEPANALANVGLAVGYELGNQDAALARLVGEAEERGASAETLNFIRAFDHRRAKRFAEGLDALELVPEELETGRRLHLLGQLHEGLGNYEQAFAAFSRMNEIQREDPSRPEERAAVYRNTVRSHCEAVTPQWVQGWRPVEPTDDRPSPVFLVGFPRSGTTLLDTMLMGHPRIEVLEEEPALRHASDHLPEFVDLPTATSAQVQAARDAYFRTAQAITPLAPGNLLLDKNPLTMNQLPIALRIFPDMRIILALRHPCDVVLSCFVTNFRLNAGMSSFLRLDTAAELYDLSFRYFEQAQQLLQLPQHIVAYENVVADREGQLRSLIEFLGVEWSDEVLDHQSTARSRGRIKTASYAQVGQAIYKQSAGRWENYRQHLEPVLPVLEPWVGKFGYSL